MWCHEGARLPQEILFLLERSERIIHYCYVSILLEKGDLALTERSEQNSIKDSVILLGGSIGECTVLLCHSCPVASQKVLNCAAILPYLQQYPIIRERR